MAWKRWQCNPGQSWTNNSELSNMSDLDPLGSMVVRIIPGIKWVYDNPPPVANLALAKEVGNNVQRSLYFHVSASEPFRVFHGVLQCQIYDGIRRQKEEAQMPQTSCEWRRYQPRCENNEETLHPLLPTSWYTAGFFSTSGRLQGNGGSVQVGGFYVYSIYA